MLLNSSKDFSQLWQGFLILRFTGCRRHPKGKKRTLKNSAVMARRKYLLPDLIERELKDSECIFNQ